MHFLLMLVRLILDRLKPDWRDGLKMAARKDGRIEQIPMQPKRSSWWINLLEEIESKQDRGRNLPRAVSRCARRPSRVSKSWLRN